MKPILQIFVIYILIHKQSKIRKIRSLAAFWTSKLVSVEKFPYLYALSIWYPSNLTRFLCLTNPIASISAMKSSTWKLLIYINTQALFSKNWNPPVRLAQTYEFWQPSISYFGVHLFENDERNENENHNWVAEFKFLLVFYHFQSYLIYYSSL